MQQNKKILMIEDDPDLCQGWSELFELMGHGMTYFHNAEEALKDQVAIQNCDVVISDFYLPDMNGVELISLIQKIRPELPCALLTGSKEAAVLDSVKELKNCRLFHKPVNVDEIERYILEEAWQPLT